MNPRKLIPVVALALVGWQLVGQVRQLLRERSVWPPDDFVEYWAAARLTLDGRNPYDPAELLPLQIAAGRDTDEAVMMWNPPWALAVVLPLGLLPAREAQLLWLLAGVASVGFSGDRLWLLYGGSRERRWVGWLLAGGFVPTLFALHAGQAGPFLLLGAVLFVACLRKGWPLQAGAATVLLAVKPHLTYLVWLAILCEAVARRRGGVLLGGIIGGVACTLVPLAFDPHVLHQYADAMGNRPPDQWVSPTLGTMLRLHFGEEQFGLQFVPVVFGLAWFAWYWQAHGRRWDWTEQTPLLLLVSFVTAPYGAWPFDLVLLVPAVFQVVLRPRAERGFWLAALAGLVAVNAACLAMNLLKVGSYEFRWVAPAVLALYAVAMRPRRVPADVVPAREAVAV